MLKSRLQITAAILLGTFLVLQTVSHGEAVAPREPLSKLPYSLAGWNGEERPLTHRAVQVAGVSDYTDRVYVNPEGSTILLYIGYYASQRTGDTIHSPKNCLPGAGWDPIHSGYIRIPIAGARTVVVNEYLIEQDENKDLVFYWYQGRGRVIASEYWGKFWMIADAIARHRTDGALIRLITPLSGGEENARARLVSFAQALFPRLEDLIPN